MTSRDDMVLRPRIARHGPSAPQARAREARQLAQAAERRGVLARLVRARAASRLVMGRRGVAVASEAAGLAEGAAARTAARSAVLNPVGMITAAAVTAIVVAGRLVSGRSFENMGQNVRQILLGDLDENALAGRDARNHLANDSDVARIAGIEGKTNAQMKAIFDDLQEARKRDHLGRELFMQSADFQVNDTLDILILRARDALVAAWNGNGGPQKVEEFRYTMQMNEVKHAR